MIGREQLERLWMSLLGLGGRRLSLLALVGVTVFGTVALSGYYLSRPDLETLYGGLNAQDVSRIGATLREAGIAFDVNSQGTAVLVRRGHGAQARMLLAEKGLPSSTSAGYELFDKMGSIGLTSFMQEVTRVRALEGEIARTIQAMRGVKAARVHIVLPDNGSFRRNRGKLRFRRPGCCSTLPRRRRRRSVRRGGLLLSVCCLPPTLMIGLAKAITDAEVETAAAYFSGLRPRKRIKVVESDMVPKSYIAGLVWAATENGEREPLGQRILEIPDDLIQFESRDPRSTFTAYVPVGSLAKGEARWRQAELPLVGGGQLDQALSW